mgnify:CR=1 FL=1
MLLYIAIKVSFRPNLAEILLCRIPLSIFFGRKTLAENILPKSFFDEKYWPKSFIAEKNFDRINIQSEKR